MLERIRLSILLQGLTLLVLLGPACEASSLGLTVHVLPLDSEKGNKVRAHFSAIAPTPCPALTGLCAAGEDCLVHTTSLPFSGTKPSAGWCVRQWQKTVPSNYSATINLGSDTEMYVSMKTGPEIRGNSGRLNHPPFVGLFPPLRARVNCPHHFHLSVKDLDGDRVRCRFARPEEEECVDCARHSFIELDEDKCSFTFTGKAAAGRYFIYLMAEDLIPAPKTSHATANDPLSSVPVHLSLTVEESTSSCSDEPVATDNTPREDSTLFVLPYQQERFDVEFESQLESVLEFGVVGPPELLRVGFKTIGPLATMTMSWVRSENKLARLLPICFAANTMSLQSEPRCVWLYQREMMELPAGTELTCEKTEMTLLLPITSLSDIDLTELQLNSPTCPVSYNSTHLTARISLTGCGTKIVHSGNEMVFTNTLKTVRVYTMVSRRPTLVLPLACRIPATQVGTPHYQIGMPKEEEVFGVVDVWIEVHTPGQGPLAEFTRTPRFRTLRVAPDRVRREAQPSLEGNSTINSTTNVIGSRITQLDLHVMSNCSIERAEMIVSNCMESSTEDFAESFPILQQGCLASNKTLEVITAKNNSKVYRLDLTSIETKGSTMYIKCTVNLCIATMPSEKCPDLCARSLNHRTLVGSLFTSTYTIKSGPVSLVVTTAAPKVTAVATTTPAAAPTIAATAAATTTTPRPVSTTSHAPEQTSAMAAGVVLTTLSIFLQNILLY